MKLTTLAVVLFFAGAVRADTIQTFEDTLHQPHDGLIVYDLTVDTSIQPTYVFDTLNGFIVDCTRTQCGTELFTNNQYAFDLSGSVILTGLGTHDPLDLIATASGARIVDLDPLDPVGTPEPNTLTFLLGSIFGVAVLSISNLLLGGRKRVHY